jgi:ADP-heptose:LPS heptosyltransferase
MQPSVTDGGAEKILVIKLSALGDVVLALGPMAAIRKAHPKAHITLLTTKPFVDIAQRSRCFDAIEADARAPFWNVAEWLRLFRFLNGGHFARVYDLQMNDRTKAYYHLFLKKPEWVGHVKGASHFFDKEELLKLHAFERHKLMLGKLGIPVDIPDLSWMSADVSLFGLKNPYVVLIPGSAPQHPQKRWPALKYGALALKLVRHGYDVAVLGTAAERDVVERIMKSCPGAHDLSGRTSLYDIATLARGAAGAIGNDTGPTHLVAMSGCPTMALFSGSTDPARSSPVGPAVTVIQSDPIDDITVDDVMKNFKPRAAA